MKVVVPGGSGQVGTLLARALGAQGDEVVIVGRGVGRGVASAPPPGVARMVAWDGKTLGPWADEIDGADVVVNLAGRTVNCRYSEKHLQEMMSSRVDSTRVVGQAIARAKRPPRVWLQAATATIYAHRFDAPNDEATGRIGGGEPGAPPLWDRSVDIAKAWERALEEAPTPSTRKVALRSAMTMSPDRGGIFDTLATLARRGLGGAANGGRQYISWIHERDWVRAARFLIERDDLSGGVNLAAPNPLPQKEFMATLRKSLGVGIGLPATRWMLELGALMMRTETELILKSRRVVPGRLLGAGFTFDFPAWPEASAELVSRLQR
jgi:uncharacterized protein (TIGR01777 family)